MNLNIILSLLFIFIFLTGCVNVSAEHTVRPDATIVGTVLLSGPAVKSGYISCEHLKNNRPDLRCKEVDSSTISMEGDMGNDQLYATKKDAGSYTEYDYYWNLDMLSNETIHNYLDYITVYARVTMPGRVIETNGQRIDEHTVYFKDLQKMPETAHVKSQVQKLSCCLVPTVILSLLLTIVFYQRT